MHATEKEKITCLTILFCDTFFSVVLTVESILLGWDMWAVLLLLLGMIFAWYAHMKEIFSVDIRIKLFFVLSMVAFFFYGIHESSMYDMAPVIIMVMLLFSVAENSIIIRSCVITYLLTLFYDVIFICKGNIDWSILGITRLLLHIALVSISSYLINAMLKRNNVDKKEMAERVGELEEANYRMEQFLTHVSHELRTPINVVTGITNVMLKKENDNQKKTDLMSIYDAGQRLFYQIEDILDYTEMDAKKINISEEPYMISSLVNDIISGCNMQSAKRKLEIIFDVDKSVPMTLIGDGRKIKKIIKHLLDNSINYTMSGGVCVRITALKKPYGVNLCISVKDTGVGVNAEELKRIKEEFYQIQNSKRRNTGGLGLGLAIVYGLVAAMNGFVQMNSEENEGMEVLISIPQKVEDENSCILVENAKKLCIACYFKLTQFDTPAVRDFYNDSIMHIGQGLNLPIYRTYSKNDLEKLIQSYQLTHIFLGQEEYQEDRAYYESLAMQMRVMLVADVDYKLSNDSRLIHIAKPLCSLTIVNALNSNIGAGQDYLSDRHIICPGLKVLVVDDEPMNLIVAKGIFCTYQMDVTTVESGMEAVDLCQKEDFDLIFLDHMMPELDGIETLKLLRKFSESARKSLTVIAFTANAVSGARQMFRDAGFDEFVSKPVENIELERVLKKVLPKNAYVYEDELVEKAALSTEHEKGTLIERLEQAGVNTRSGMVYASGDMSIYMDLLKEYIFNAPIKCAEIEKFYEAEDYNNYRIRVHALKSTSKMIGLDGLSELAKDAEEAAKKQDEDYLKTYGRRLIDLYQSEADKVRNILDVDRENNTEQPLMKISKQDFIQQLQELKYSLSTYEVDKIDSLILQLNGEMVEEKQVSVLIEEIAKDIQNFDFDIASTKAEELLAEMEV